jgi:hypothetical protein
VDHPLNSHPDRAYSPLEAALGRLEALTDVQAAAHARYAALYAARDEYGRCVMDLEGALFCVQRRPAEGGFTKAWRAHVARLAAF